MFVLEGMVDETKNSVRKRYKMLDNIKAKGSYALMRRTAGDRELWSADST